MKRRISFIWNVFCMVTTCVVIGTAFFVTVVNPAEVIPTETLWQIPAVSMVTALIPLIYPWDVEMGKLGLGIRICIHYLLTCGVVLYAGWQFEWYNIHNTGEVVGMLVMISLIFAVVSAVTWARSFHEAKRMNEKLQEYRNRTASNSEEKLDGNLKK